MDVRTIQALRDAAALLSLVSELTAIAQATYNRIAQAAHTPISDADLDALAAARKTALDRLATIAAR